MLKKVPVQDAVGTTLAHDMTEIRPGEFKGPAFKKGHTVCDSDICRLQKMGKNHIYLLDMEEDEIHENQAAEILAQGLAGEGITWENNPSEGKITLHAAHDGILEINTAALAAVNLIDEVMCATRHTHSRVQKGDLVAATRAIPLVMKRSPVERAAKIAANEGGLVHVKKVRSLKAGLIITGSEVFHGLIEDKFAPILTRKLEDLGSTAAQVTFTPDDADAIKDAIEASIAQGCELLILTGGMSVDPDDVTRAGVTMAGAREMHYGSAVLPGAMFLMATVGEVPLMGVPACGLHHRTTVLDLILPRVLAGETIGKKELAFLGHGGLCLDCKPCIFPRCSFGKGM